MQLDLPHSRAKVGALGFSKTFPSTFALLTLAITPCLHAWSPTAQTFLNEHCFECHDSDVQKGDLDLTTLDASLTDPGTLIGWLNVHDRVKAGEMPPAKKPQPASAEVVAFLAELRAPIISAELTQQAELGRSTLRRLNRVEYQNTLSDLLHVPQLEIEALLPADGKAHGFAKSAEALDFSHVQIGAFMEEADLALLAAVAPTFDPPQPETLRVTCREMNLLGVQMMQLKAVGLHQGKLDPTFSVLEGNFQQRLQGWINDPPPHYDAVATFMQRPERINGFQAWYSGRYKLRVRAFGVAWADNTLQPGQQVEAISLYTGTRALGTVDIPPNEPTTRELDVWLNVGDKITYSIASAHHFDLNGVRGVGGTKVTQLEANGVALEWFELEGPLHDQWPPASHRALLGDLKPVRLPTPPPTPKNSVAAARQANRNRSTSALTEAELKRRYHNPPDTNPEYILNTRQYPQDGSVPHLPRDYKLTPSDPEAKARQLLKDFASRAYRRPVQAAQLDLAIAAVRQQLQRSDDFIDAMLDGYRTLLCSPDFLMFREEVGSLDAHALASRLSYFLTNTTPDSSLRAAADDGTLTDPKVLRAHTDRLLDSPQATRFHQHFLDYWLNLKDIRLTEPDEALYPEFNQLMLESMLHETHSYFAQLLHRNLPARNIVASDFSMLNRSLARLYGLPDIQTHQVQPVSLPADSHRGGFITQASVLKVTANGTNTSPVVRGTWLLEHILGTPPPPPPPTVPAIEPDVSGATTIKQQLEKHREMESCAGCHRLIDPPGFAFENFDVMGMWRDRYRAISKSNPVPGSKDGKPYQFKLAQAVESAATLHSGETFTGIDAFRVYLLTQEHQIARNFLHQLTTYATGAPVSLADEEIIEPILDDLAPRGFPIRSMIHALVQSSLFTCK